MLYDDDFYHGYIFRFSSLKESSEIEIRLFHISSSSKEKPLGAVVVSAKELIAVGSDPIRTLCQISFELNLTDIAVPLQVVNTGSMRLHDPAPSLP
jgi:hypothetical protein